MAERPPQRPRGIQGPPSRPRLRDAKENAEEVTSRIRERIDQVIAQEGRVSPAPGRKAIIGTFLGALALAGVLKLAQQSEAPDSTPQMPVPTLPVPATPEAPAPTCASSEKVPVKKASRAERKRLEKELYEASKAKIFTEPELRAWLSEKWLPVFGGYAVDCVTGDPVLGKPADLIKPTDTLVTIGTDDKGKPIQIRGPVLSERLAKANELLKEKNKKVGVVEGRRSVYDQYLVWLKAANGVEDGAVKKGFRASPPGIGFHAPGLAIHVPNIDDNDVQEALFKNEILGGAYGMEDDFWHCSYGEIGVKEWWDVKINEFKRNSKHAPEWMKKEGKKLGKWATDKLGDLSDKVKSRVKSGWDKWQDRRRRKR